MDIRDRIGGLVEARRGRVARAIFSDDEIYRLEQERIFGRAWLYVGHVSQVRNPGDFVLGRMGEEAVILVRDRKGQLHVFLNSCRHRGMQVCRYEQGHAPAFTCPYHAWTFALDGALMGVPQYSSAYGAALDKSQWGLKEVAQLHVHKGAVFATWDAKAPDFATYAGRFAGFLDDMLDGVDGEEGKAEVLEGIQKWKAPANWKFGAENSVGDMYHNVSHESVDRIGIGPSGKGRRDNEEVKGRLVTVSDPTRGHGGVALVYDEDLPWTPTYQDNKVAADYFEQAYYNRQRLLGPRARVTAQVGNLFPNMSFLARQPRRIALWSPDGGPQKSEYWAIYLVDSDMPAEVRNMLRHYFLRYIGPAGMTEQDDMENWNLSSKGTVGPVARGMDFNYVLGLETPPVQHPHLPGDVGPTLSEIGARGLYGFWAEMMAGETWDEIIDARDEVRLAAERETA